jgi:hypothetical protein
MVQVTILAVLSSFSLAIFHRDFSIFPKAQSHVSEPVKYRNQNI